jgi:hypothetical protein
MLATAISKITHDGKEYQVDTTEKWKEFFQTMRNSVKSIVFYHKMIQHFVTTKHGPSNYYTNSDSILYTCDDGDHGSREGKEEKKEQDGGGHDEIVVEYGASIYCQNKGTMREQKDKYLFRQFNLIPWKEDTPVRVLAKNDFFSTLSMIEEEYWLGLFLLTFEDVLCMTVYSQMSAQLVKICNKSCKPFCKSVRDSCSNCVIL